MEIIDQIGCQFLQKLDQIWQLEEHHTQYVHINECSYGG